MNEFGYFANINTYTTSLCSTSITELNIVHFQLAGDAAKHDSYSSYLQFCIDHLIQKRHVTSTNGDHTHTLSITEIAYTKGIREGAEQ